MPGSDSPGAAGCGDLSVAAGSADREMQVDHRIAHAIHQRVAIVERQAGGGNRLADHQVDAAGLDAQRVALQQVVRAIDGHRHDRYASLDGHDEQALFEGALCVHRASACPRERSGC